MIPNGSGSAHGCRARAVAAWRKPLGRAYVTAMWPIDRSPQWVGRRQELAILHAGIEALGRGEGAVVWVEGEPGIGKSSLVAEALATQSDPEWDIGWGVADQLTERLPLQVMLDCLRVRPGSRDPRRAHAGDLLSSRRLELFADGDVSVAGVEVLMTLADELSAAAPTVLVVDDLQWADKASLIVWHQLAASAGQLRLLLIGTCRPTPQAHPESHRPGEPGFPRRRARAGAGAGRRYAAGHAGTGRAHPAARRREHPDPPVAAGPGAARARRGRPADGAGRGPGLPGGGRGGDQPGPGGLGQPAVPRTARGRS